MLRTSRLSSEDLSLGSVVRFRGCVECVVNSKGNAVCYRLL